MSAISIPATNVSSLLNTTSNVVVEKELKKPELFPLDMVAQVQDPLAALVEKDLVETDLASSKIAADEQTFSLNVQSLKV